MVKCYDLIILAVVQSVAEGLCPKGRHVSGSGACIACAVGKFQNTSNFSGSSCNFCSKGKYQTEPAQENCIHCTPGKYQEKKGSVDCKSCAVGTHSKSNGAIFCQSCTTVGDKSFQNEAEKNVCKTCSCATNNAKSGFGQACMTACTTVLPDRIFLIRIRGNGYEGQLDQSQLMDTTNIFEQTLQAQKNDIQIYLQDLRNGKEPVVLTTNYYTYEAAVFSSMQYTLTLTDLENSLKQQLEQVSGIEVLSVRAQAQQQVVQNTTTDSSSLGTPEIIGASIGATILAAVAANPKAIREILNQSAQNPQPGSVMQSNNLVQRTEPFAKPADTMQTSADVLSKNENTVKQQQIQAKPQQTPQNPIKTPVSKQRPAKGNSAETKTLLPSEQTTKNNNVKLKLFI